MKVETQKKDNYLVFIVTGIFDLNEAIDKYPLLITACLQAGMAKVMIDYRGLSGEISATPEALYALQFADFYKEHLSSGGAPIKFAFVGKDPNPWGLGEEIGRYSGLEVLVINDTQRALDWLG